MSNAGQDTPRASWTITAADGSSRSGVQVAITIRSSCSGGIAAASKARRGLGRQRHRGLALAHEPAFPDPRAVDDPLVIRLDEILEEGVRNDALGEGGPGRRDGGEPPSGLRHSRSTQATA